MQGVKPCLLWKGKLNKPNGYGCFYRDGKRVLAHRDAYEKAYGPIPDGMSVLHWCDVKVCIEPTHLKVGTIAENNQEARERGQWKPHIGVAHGMAKINDDDVREIRRLWANGGITSKALGERYDLTGRQILNIAYRLQWSHVQ